MKIKIKKRFKIKKKIKEVKKIKIKVPEINPLKFIPDQDGIPFIQAAYAKIGEKFYNYGFTAIITIVSVNTHDHWNIKEWEISYTAESIDGITIEFDGKIRGTTPIVPYNKSYTLGGILDMKIKKKAVEKEAVSAKKKAQGKKLAAKAKEALDPKIGAKPGTSSFEVGKVMLSIKPGKDHKAKVVDATWKLFKDKGEKAARVYAGAWYTQLIKKKPEIYGKFGK